jgi:microcystin-dependent protein
VASAGSTGSLVTSSNNVASTSVTPGVSTSIGNQNALHTHGFTVDIGAFDSGGHSVDHNHTTTVDIASFNSGSTGDGGAHNNLQPYIVLHYIIKT